MKMPWTRTKQAVEVASAVAVVEPESATPSRSPVWDGLKSDELAEYTAVAARVGLDSSYPPLVEEAIRRTLQDENIHIYSRIQVVEFLNAKLGKWHWSGLRKSDVKHLPGTWRMHAGKHRIPFSDLVYTQAVPLPVLLTIEKIATAVPEAHFYISTAGDPKEDPFLMVTARGVASFIVERWDEPNFRER